MTDEDAEVDRLRSAHKAASETWIMVIRADEQFEPADHTSVQIDTWEDVHFGAEDRRHEAEAAEMACEGALRSRFFDID
jgi:hypothetical protein